MFLRLLIIFGLFCIQSLFIHAQQPAKPTSGEIYKSLEKLNFLGNALFVAAHPDDENTRLISYLVNELNAHTTYLSITRGDGGQNLIGPEIEELLGVIRTQELLQARKIDGGNQMFTRANDFGFSKNAEETRAIWSDEDVKQDVVWAIRKVKPDVIINRFDHRTSGSTHGHHTASAMLAHELFDNASNPEVYSHQLKYTSTWKPSRLFFNISWFFFGSQEAFNKADKSGFLSFDVGGYYPLLGKSNTEIAALSRSKHKCQGFGSTGTRGQQTEYLELLKGSMPINKSNLFEGINTTWTRLEGGQKIKMIMDEVMLKFDFRAPEKSLPLLIKVYPLISNIKDDFWRDRKLSELKNIISQCLGLYYDAIAQNHTAIPGEQIKIDIEMVKRLPGNATLKGIKILPTGKDTSLNVVLNNNETYLQSYVYDVPKTMNYTNAYWLNDKGTLGMYKVDQVEWIGKPETPRPIKVVFAISIEGINMDFEKSIAYKYNSPEDGEVYRPFEITPEVFVNFKEKVYIFGNDIPKKVKVVVKAGANNQKGTISLPVTEGWKVSPEAYPFELKDKNSTKEFEFEVTPPKNASEITFTPLAIINEKSYTKQLIEIKYDHIPMQLVLATAESKMVKIDIARAGNNIAYIPGAGDEVAQSLRQIGYDVTEIEAKDISSEILKQFDAVILGVRAYNVNEDLKFKQEDILNYAKNGGTVIAQYNTNSRLTVGQNLGPYPMKIGRDRVTVESAPMNILSPDHAVVNYPNKITQEDFKGWVQERGLYFATEWDANFIPIISTNDPNEEEKKGGLLVAKYGQGYFAYTGLSFFRQLPAGVSGAFRLFSNLVSLGKKA
ncbi:MAG: hypothetical protein RLZZ546_2493 [Bacteroidota bacterium]|jgi:LmbE family N-acetylglucosaminyl deacetylase